ncbi:tryptophan halogenase family protein [Asticcacaulis sp. BE141]|uniref:tryptophan halogenase family protein n=1 Tax=Asticcacaulis TaxID=76890 RepID=UPI001FD987B4|nr:tryptophan halogenase [Asticcacaulis solisilvae]MDR6802644.1 tryptophan halogenase [Asticcacaulis sp. BE141]
MTAALLAKLTQNKLGKIHLIESEAIGTIGVGEATIPPILDFNRLLEINDADFLRETRATFKLGIEFRDWKRLGESYMHPFGTVGAGVGRAAFHHSYIRARMAGDPTPFEAYSLASVAGRQARFAPPPAGDRGVHSTIGYAFHFDAGLYAAFLRRYAEARGVTRHEGRIIHVAQRPEDGFISSVTTENGLTLEGDLFMDCTGMQALLMEKTLQTGFEDWSAWLPASRAWAVPSANAGPLLPYTRSTAHGAGWQWRIPLQHRIGNGIVFSHDFIEETKACDILMSHLDSKALMDPRLIRFRTGRSKAFWNKNVVAIGLSGGFMEPLESTSIHLIHSSLIKLMDLFPDADFNPLLAKQYNTAVGLDFETIRDFLILHYKVTERTDSEFWNYCRNMSIPASLQYKIDQFVENGRVVMSRGDLFQLPSWLSVMLGQGLIPKRYDPLAKLVESRTLTETLATMRETIASHAGRLPLHSQFLRQIGMELSGEDQA